MNTFDLIQPKQIDFKSGVETIFVSKDNKQEYIEVDDFVRQGDYKYTYSDSSSTAIKSEQADLVVSAVERFAQQIPLNMQEIFIWYFEQKGVDNPERFLIQDAQTVLPQENVSSPLTNMTENVQPENPLNQILKLLPTNKKEADISNIISKLKTSRKQRKGKK